MLFSEVPGQEQIKNRLLNVCNNSRIPHAMLFYGPGGNGGLALALAVATYLLCENRTETDACGQCDTCSKTRSLIHPDLHFSFPIINKDGTKTSDPFIAEWRKALLENPFMDYEDWMEAIKGRDDQNKQGNITAEECRDIIRKLGLKSFEGGKKFMIIWLPEFLGQSGNILLKILEEPPADTHFILVAEDLNQVLPTILSRTQLFNIPAFEAGEIKNWLKEKNTMDASRAEVIAFLSRGNISMARKMESDEDTGYTERQRLWFQHCYTGNISGINTWVSETAGLGREKIKQFLENSLYILDECLHAGLRNGYKPRVPAIHEEFVVNLSRILNSDKIDRMYRKINDTIYHIDRNANPRISLYTLSLELRDILRIKEEA